MSVKLVVLGVMREFLIEQDYTVCPEKFNNARFSQFLDDKSRYRQKSKCLFIFYSEIEIF